MEWYNALAKPSWTPAPATIGLIWTILYPIIAVSFGLVFV
jgi:benzodiazapine receptor